MLEEVVVIVWVEDELDSILTVDCSNGNVLCGIRKKLWTTVFFTSKSIVISEASSNGVQKEKFNDVTRGGRQCLSRRSAWLHLNCGLYQWKRTLRNPQKIVNNSLLHQ